MATFADLEQAIKDLPDADYRVFTSGAKPATEAEIAALEAHAGRPIPPALRELYASWGVLVVEVLDTVWPRPKLLGKVGDKSAKAVALYRKGLESEDAGTFSYAAEAVKAIHATALVPTLEARLDGDLEAEQRGTIIALLGHLGAPYVPHVTALLDELTGDGDFSAVLRALEGLPVAETELAPKLLERYRAVDPKSRGAIEVIEALVALGIEDRATMEPTLRQHFVPRGGRWTTRAEAVLEKWK